LAAAARVADRDADRHGDRDSDREREADVSDVLDEPRSDARGPRPFLGIHDPREGLGDNVHRAPFRVHGMSARPASTMSASRARAMTTVPTTPAAISSAKPR